MNTKIEIFCGTGGVGKTTLSASRAIHLGQEKRVLLITIDPAKRLKQVLGMSEENSGKLEQISVRKGNSESNFDALLLSPRLSFQRALKKSNFELPENNKILNVLLRPYGGLNEILALLELSYWEKQGVYDVIIIDTPPGNHFLDFLNSGKKINLFFNKTFVEVINLISKKSEKVNLFKTVMKTGINKLLDYLKQVTGQSFVDEFIQAISLVYNLKDEFLLAAKLPMRLKEHINVKWFLVTALNQEKVVEAESLKSQIEEFTDSNITFCLNKSLKSYCNYWEPTTCRQKSLKTSLLRREESILSNALRYVKHFYLFPDIISSSPYDHVTQLADEWIKGENYELQNIEQK